MQKGRSEETMSNFTPAEIEYLNNQRLGRLATVNAAGEPHVVPVVFRYNAEFDSIDIGGHNFGKSRKFRDATRRGVVAFVVDDVLPPWQPRGIEIRGRVDAFTEGGQQIIPGFDAEFIRVHPTRIVSWGIDSDAFHTNNRVVGK
jgi:pyridoxamine 5'-phosphate oxidase family protein